MKLNFEECFEEYKDSLENYSLNLAKTSEVDGEDVFLESMNKAEKHFGEFKAGTNFEAWVRTIIFRTYIDHFRKSKTFPQRTSNDYYLGQVAESENSAEDRVIISEEEEKVKAALANLSEDKQKIIYCYYFKGLKYKEIAKVLDLPIGTVMSRLNRAKQELKKILSKNI
ncbi:MAG: sigma-70 family RNA polymerase sigma factor [Candidatus Ancillula sp.]|nr:sigma-70 family RNA polymerase sigma factor [Candidatus Ancillula sp.]